MRLPQTLISLASLAFVGGTSPVLAQASDARIVVAPYKSDAVYPITISLGHAAVVELERNEAIESIALGDPDNWRVETTASANRLIVNPGDNARPTNMVVLTTKRTYAFTLDAFTGSETFLMRFTYNEPLLKEVTYRMRGEPSLFPMEITDNGRITAIFWPPESEFPAIFVLDEEGDEIIPDYRPAGNGLIIEGVFERIVFRSGKRKATAKRCEQSSGG